MGDLRGEVVALDAIGVVQVVEGVIDRQPEPSPPGDQALLNFRRNSNLGDLVEYFGRDRHEPDQRRARAGPEHHLKRPLQGEDLGIEPRAGDDVCQEILDVVEHAGL